MIENIDSKYIQTFEYETSMISDGNILGTCELGTATIQMINDSNTYSSLKGQWIKTIHGSFYVYDVKPVQEKVNIELSCYDIKYKLDTTYDSGKYTFPCTLKAWRNSIFTECGVTYDDSDFPNSDLNLEKEPYVGDNPSNRQVMSLIAQAGASFIITDKNDKFYFKWFKNTTNNITDWLELTTEKEATSPINVIVLGRGDVEDNVYYPETLPENKKELRIDNNYILDPQIAGETDRRYAVRKPIYNQINGFSFIPFSIRTQNVKNKLSIDLGDKVSYTDIWGNNLSSYVMTKKITYLGGNPSDDDNYEITLSAEEINETSTEYSYGSSIEQRLSKVEITTDKQNKKITALVEETTTKITNIEKSVPKYQTELDIYNITIPVDSELKPLENKDYSIEYKTKFEGAEVESTISSQSENAGITFGLSNNKITLSVLTSTAITSLSNEFVIDFSYTKDSTTYTDSKKIIVTLALKGSAAEKPESTKTAEGTELVIADGKQVVEFRVDGKCTQETSTQGKNLFDGIMESGGINNTTGDNQANESLVRSKNYVSVKPNTTYIISNNGVGVAMNVLEYANDKSFISFAGVITAGKPFTTSSTTHYIRFYRSNSNADKIQVEAGNTITNLVAFTPNMPSPDYPSEVECVKGKNLFNENDLTFTNTKNAKIEINNHVITMTTLQEKSSNDLFVIGKIDDSLLIDGESYTISSINVSGMVQNFRLQLRTKSGGYVAGQSARSTIVYDNAYSLYVINNPYATSVSTVIPAGTVAVVKNIQVKKGSVAIDTDYVPYNNLQIRNVGKQLLSLKNGTYSNNGITAVVNNGVISLSGTATATSFVNVQLNEEYADLVMNKTITISLNNPKVNANCRLKLDDPGLYPLTALKENNTKSYTITTSPIPGAISIRTQSGATYQNGFTLKPQIELGTIATPYSICQLQKLNVDLQGNELCSIGDVKDELIIKDGRAKIIKRIGKVIFNGSESAWYAVSEGFYITTAAWKNKSRSETLTNYFQTFTVYRGGLADADNGAGFLYPNINQYYLKIDGITTLPELKTWLSSHNTTVYYQLAEEQEIDLGKIANIPMREEETNIYYVNDKLAPNIYCKYNTTYVGNNSYLHVKYSNDGTTFTSNNGDDVGRYIGSYSDNNETASTNFDDYSWQDTAIVVDEELDDLQGQIDNTNKDLNNNYTNNTELDRKLENQKQTITEEFSTRITMTKKEWEASVLEYINTNGVEKFVNTLVSIDIDGLKLSKSDEDIVSLLNNKGLYVSDGKLRDDLTNLLMKVDRAGALFKLLEVLGTIKEQGIIQKEKITDETFGECQAWYWIGSD